MKTQVDKFEKWVIPSVKAILLLGGIGILYTIGFYFFYDHISFEDVNPKKIGPFGDFIGGFFGTLFTVAATLLIWLTYNSQKAELHETREVAKQQQKTLELQRFENTFFQMLENYNSIVNNLKIEKFTIGGTDYIEGRSCFNELADEFVKQFNNACREIAGGEITDEDIFMMKMEADTDKTEILRKAYERTFNFRDDILSHYFRNMYHIVKYVHLSKSIKGQSDKQFYVNILRAQLSSNELIMLYNNLLVDGLGYPKFLYLASKYDFLQNLNWEKIRTKNSREGIDLTIDEYQQVIENLAIDAKNDPQTNDLIPS